MIETAIEVFGSLGYEGASTRTFADRAGVNLSAIPYHFGGKRELYLAAAQSIADYARKRIDPIVALLRDANMKNRVMRIDEALSNFFHFIVGGSEPEAWAFFFVRCEHEADDAFRILYEEVVGRFQRVLIETVAAETGRDAGDERLRIRVAVVLTSIVNFRTLRNMTLNSLGWDRFNPDRLSKLDKAVRQLALDDLLSFSSKKTR